AYGRSPKPLKELDNEMPLGKGGRRVEGICSPSHAFCAPTRKGCLRQAGARCPAQSPESTGPDALNPSGLFLVLAAGKYCAETVGAREALGSKSAGIGAIAAPIRILLADERELAPGRVGPSQAVLRLEGFQVGQSTVLEALQPDTTAAPHLGHLLELEDHHLAVLTDRGHEFTLDHRERPRHVRRFDVEHLLALAGVGQALVLGHHDATPLRAPDQEFSPTFVAEDGDQIVLLLEIDEQPDRLTMPAPARQLGAVYAVE